MASFQVFGQGGISHSSRAGAPRSWFSHLALSGGVEATVSAEDLTLWLAPFTPPSDDKSHAQSHGYGSRRKLPSLCWRG